MKPVSIVPACRRSRSTVTVLVWPPRCSAASNSVISWRAMQRAPPRRFPRRRRRRSRPSSGGADAGEWAAAANHRVRSVVTRARATADHVQRWRKWETDRRMTTTLMKRDAREMAATQRDARREPQTLSTYIQSRFDECSRSQKDVAQYIIDHLDEAAFQTAEELARRANTSSSTVVRFSQALGFEGFPELQRAAREEYKRAHGARPRRLAAVLDRAHRVRDLDRRRPRERRGERAQGEPRDDRARDRRDRRRRPDRDRRHRPDGVLRQLPAPPADAARPARRARREPVAGGAQPPRADRLRHARDRAVRRTPARARRARDEARAPPQGR